ncbi:LysM peptidoglycan-binding domain-containing protein [Paenibacillus sp. VCA1]|uniref:LysM peptidoglycan-binding domain-containing protein n=1 Tax=Paenibacillus sp. VCA1 TaxID=3039148 RepID=UPI002872AB14|nr:LysM peptidoglycan-binding domain-containing protein [Paenibacillus sp. VCA1]MDR9857310.1 LysM peptidoglycan-binding domain-containing protein [Paenibacillus sp. VCA1]
MKIHIVKSGDTLYELSKKYDIPLQKIIDANPQISDPNELQVGQKVKIPAEPVQVPSPDHIIHKHVVKQGDTLWKLSKAWGVSLKEMIDANPQLKNPNALLVGEVVNIPKTKGNPGPADDPNPSANVNENANVQHEKLQPGGKAYTGPKEEMTAPKAEVTAPKAEMTAPSQVQPQQLPELPNVPLPNLMPEMTLPNLPNIPNMMPNVSNVMPEMTAPNVMPNVMAENIHPNVMPNVMAENIHPNVMPNVMAENIHPNVMPNVMAENIHPNVMPNVMAENIHPNVIPNVMAENIHPNVMPNVMAENIHPNVMPNVTPNIMPLSEKKPSGVKPVAEEPCGCEGAHHPFMQFPTAVHEVGSFYHTPCDEEVQAVHTYGNKPYPGKSSHYPGIVAGAEDYEMPNQHWVSPSWENQASPVAYEPNMKFPVSHQPNQPYHPGQVSPIYYEPVHAPNPCGCSGTAPVFHAPEPAFVQPAVYDPYCYPHFVLPPWCYPHPAPVPLVGSYGVEPNAPLGAHAHGPNMPYHDPNMPYHDPNMPYHDPNMPFPGWSGMEYPVWDRAQAQAQVQAYTFPPQQAEPESESEPSAAVNAVQAAAQAPIETFEDVEATGKTEADPGKTAKTLNSTKRSATSSRDKSVSNKAKKQNSSRRKNPWIKG